MSSRPEPPALIAGVIASVAHELNNQLAILMGRAELMAEDVAGQPALSDDLRVIREAAAHSHQAAQTLVGLVRPRARPPGRVGLNELAQAAAQTLAYTLRSAGIDLTVTPSPAAPQAEADEGEMALAVLVMLHLVQRQARPQAPCGLQLTVETVAGGAQIAVHGPTMTFEPADLQALAALAGGAALQAGPQGLALRFAVV